MATVAVAATEGFFGVGITAGCKDTKGRIFSVWFLARIWVVGLGRRSLLLLFEWSPVESRGFVL